MRFKRLGQIVAGCSVIAATILLFTGSVIVVDPHRQLASAQLIDGWGHKQPLLNLVYLRVGVPRIEGAVQITCKNGRVIELAYVTPGAPTWVRALGC